MKGSFRITFLNLKVRAADLAKVGNRTETNRGGPHTIFSVYLVGEEEDLEFLPVHY